MGLVCRGLREEVRKVRITGVARTPSARSNLGLRVRGWRSGVMGLGVRGRHGEAERETNRIRNRCRANISHIRQSTPDSGLIVLLSYFSRALI